MNVTINADQLNAIHDTLRNRKRSVSADGIATDHLRSIVERIERLEREKTDLASDIKDIYTEAKSAGFDASVLRRLVATRKKDAADVEEAETLLDLYRRAMAE
jgi:uncharacterized protein (UPF0335 family)